MKFFELIEIIHNMNNGNHPAKLTEAIKNKNNPEALTLIQNKTLSAKLYRAGFYVMNGGHSLLETGWGGVDSPLQHAAADGNMPVLQALLKAGAKVDSKDYLGWTPLCSALRHSHIEAAIALINAGADVNALFRSINAGSGDKTSYYPLHVAIRSKLKLPIIQLLVEKGAELNVAECYNNILCEAVSYYSDDDVAIIEFLLQQGADPNRAGMSHDSRGYHITSSPLYFALDKGKISIARALLLRGANIYAEKPRSYWEQNRYFANQDRYYLSQDLMDIAIRICRENNIAVPLQPAARALREQPLLHAFATPANGKNEINTHSVTIHKTVSESAARLQKSSTLTNSSQISLQIITDCLSVPENLIAIQNLIMHAAKGLSFAPKPSDISSAVSALMQRIAKATFIDDGRDYGSKVKLSFLIILILEAISKLPDSVQRDALLKLCEHMYFSKIEGICESGIFNNLVYSQQSILAEVQVLIQTKADATNSCSNQLKNFAEKIYLAEGPFDDHNAFEAAVKTNATPEACAKIMRDIFAEYYLVFNLKSPQTAATLSSKDLDKLCRGFIGLELKDIFDNLDYVHVYQNLSVSTKLNSVNSSLVLANQ